MRKLIVFNMISADGYFKGDEDNISWHRVDGEVNEFLIEQLKTGDTILMGRKTFEVMEAFWPTAKVAESDPVMAKMMTDYVKMVFSTTRSGSAWQHTEWYNSGLSDTVKKVKAQQGKNIFVLGSGRLCETLIKNKLVDEYRFMINAVALGNDKSFFADKVELQLLKTKVFGNGNVLLCYQPEE